jgi:hypothetical protein
VLFGCSRRVGAGCPLHLTCAAWGAYSEFTGTICPLTPLEPLPPAGRGGWYQGGFIEHYLWP